MPTGYKASFGGSTTPSAAASYCDYSDFQVSRIIGISLVTRNAGDVEVRGLDLELSTLSENSFFGRLVRRDAVGVGRLVTR